MRVAVARALPQVIEDTADAAMNNIEQDTKRIHHGREYPSRREPGVMHTASAPGESFATDTESLIAGISKEQLTPLSMAVNFADELGAHRWLTFEFGSARIAARPTVVPVFGHMQDQFTRDVAGAVLEALTEQEVK